MTPLELTEIQHELELFDAEFAQALELDSADTLAELQAGDRLILPLTAIRAAQLLDDWRYARLILEKKIRPQFEALLAAGEKPAMVALITELDSDNPEHWTAAKANAPLSLYKQIDRAAKAYFDEQDVEIISKAEFIKPPPAVPGEEAPEALNGVGVLGVRVEAV